MSIEQAVRDFFCVITERDRHYHNRLYFSRERAESWLLVRTSENGYLYLYELIIDTNVYQFISSRYLGGTYFKTSIIPPEYELAEELSADDYFKWLNANK